MPLTYHPGQIEVQAEANTRKLADQLAGWVGPVGEFATTADLVLLASRDAAGELAFTAISGAAPLVEMVGPGALRLPLLRTQAADRLVGGLTISLAQSRRARLNGLLNGAPEGAVLQAHEAFTNCCKYIVPSLAIEDEPLVGPVSRERVDLDEPWLTAIVAGAETSFLASVSPEGQPDVSHRGGPAGFLSLDVAGGHLTWPEYIGDGMFKSAGNVRATCDVTLLVLDVATGDAAEIRGIAPYETLRTMKQARLDALQQHRDPFPVQGRMTLEVVDVLRLTSMIRPRRRLDGISRVTSSSPTYEQSPQ